MSQFGSDTPMIARKLEKADIRIRII